MELGLKASVVIGRCGGAGSPGCSRARARSACRATRPGWLSRAGDWTFDAPLIKAKYPSYKQVIPAMQGLGNKVAFSVQDAKRISEAMSQSASKVLGAYGAGVHPPRGEGRGGHSRDDAKFTAVVEAQADVAGMKEGETLAIDRRDVAGTPSSSGSGRSCSAYPARPWSPWVMGKAT